MFWLGTAAGQFLGSAALGLLAGRGKKAPKSIGNRYYDQAFQEAMKIYEGTDFDKLDEQALEQYSSAAKAEGEDLLTDYDASAAGAGSMISKADTNKDLARASIAGNVGRDIARKRAELLLSRPMRRRALLPGLDQPSSLGLEQRPGNLQALSTLGQVNWSDLWRTRPSGGGGGSDSSQDYGQTPVPRRR